MLDQTGKVLDKYKNDIKGHTVHEFLTLASIVQSEGLNKDDMPYISVFYNRLDKKCPLVVVQHLLCSEI